MSINTKSYLPLIPFKLNLATVAIAIYLLLYLLPLGVRPLSIPDEGRYAEIPREMLQSGDWIVPRLNGLRYFEKPPMGYWLNAVSMYLFGENPFAVRLSGAVAAGLTSWIVFLLALQARLNRRTAIAAALIQLTFLEVYAAGSFSILDNALTLFLTAGIAGFYYAVQSNKYRYWLFSGMMFGCAFLTKGFLAFAIPAIVLIPWMLWAKNWQLLFSRGWLVILAAILVSLPWAIMIQIREADFWHYFFWVEHVKRFFADNAQHEAPFYYFLLFFPLLAFPWISFIPAAISGFVLGERKLNNPLISLLILWVMLPFVFFSLSSGKLVTYLLPIFPPLAVLMAAGLANYLSRAKIPLFKIGIILNGLALMTLLIAVMLSDIHLFKINIYEHQQVQAGLLAGALLAGLIIAIVTYRYQKKDYKLLASVMIVVPFLAVLNLVIPEKVYKSKAPGILLEQYRNLATKNAMVISDASTFHAVAWYLKRRNIYLISKGEVTYGLAYPDAASRFLNAAAVKKLVTQQTNQYPIIIVCRNNCDEMGANSFLEAIKQKYEYGVFVLYYIPARPSQSPISRP